MFRRMVVSAAAATFAVLAIPTSAQATGGESNWSLGYANMKVKAYHCTWYLKNCDWRGETIVFQKTAGKYMQWVQNEATVTVQGIGLSSLSISKNPSATIVSNVNSSAKVRWLAAVRLEQRLQLGQRLRGLQQHVGLAEQLREW